MTPNDLSRRSLLTAPLALALAGSAIARQDDEPAREHGIKKGRLKQSGVGWCYGGPLEELCQLSVELGLSGIDVVHPRDFPLLKKYGLVSTMTPSMERGIGIGNSINKKENHETALEILKQRIDQNAEAGFENVIVFSGNRQADLSDKEGLENCAEALGQITDYAAEKGQTIQMELLNSKRDHRGYMCDRSTWGVDLVQKVGSDSFKILYDIYHAQIMEGDIIATIQEHHEHFGHYHTAGVPGRSNIDETQELYYPAIMEAIAATGFKGYVGQEFRPRGDRRKAMIHAVETCDV